MLVRSFAVMCAMVGLVWMLLNALIRPESLGPIELSQQASTCAVLLYVILRASVEMDRIRRSRIKSRLKRRQDD